MLTTAQPVTEIVQHVYYVLANEMCRHILQEIGILEFLDNKIYINSTLHNPSKSYDQNLNPILVEDRFTCVFDMKHSSLGLTWDNTTVAQHMDSARHRRDRLSTLPILLDKEHHITLSDSVLPFNLNMNCTLSLRDYNLAHEVIDRFHLKFNKGETVSLANLSYDFPLPMNILKTLWALASTLGVSKKCFPVWLEQYSNGAIKRIVTTGLKSKSVEFVVKRHVFESLVKIDYDLNSDPDKEGNQQSETLGLQFQATLHSTRPSVLYVDYPIIINNTLVPPEIVHVDTSYQNELYKILHHPERFMNPVYQESKMLMKDPVRNPWYDDWKVPIYNTLHTDLESIPFFIGAFTLDYPCPTPYEPCPCRNSYTSINIVKDLDMYKLTDKVLLYYKIKKERALQVYCSYNIAVYMDDMMMDPNDLEFDGEILKVPNRFGANHIYRLVMSYTRRRHIDKAEEELQAYDPYTLDYTFISSVISKHEAIARILAQTPQTEGNLSAYGVLTTQQTVLLIRHILALKKECKDEVELREILVKNMKEAYPMMSNRVVNDVAEELMAPYRRNNAQYKGVLEQCKKYNLVFPGLIAKIAELLLRENPTQTLKSDVLAYLAESYPEFDVDTLNAVADAGIAKYEPYATVEEAADKLMDIYASGKGCNFISVNNEIYRSPFLLALNCVISFNQ